MCLGLRALPAYLPPYLRFMSVGAGMAVGYLENVTNTLSTYALVYVGLTGDPFFPSARRSRALTGAVESSNLARYRQKFQSESEFAFPCYVRITDFVPLAPLAMLTVAPLTLTFPFALTTYLFVAHTLNAPGHALAAAVLAGGVTALVGLFSVGLVKDTYVETPSRLTQLLTVSFCSADTLYMCYCIDKDVGARHRDEVFATVRKIYYGKCPFS